MNHRPANRMLILSLVMLSLAISGWFAFLSYLSGQADLSATLAGELVRLESTDDRVAALKNVVQQSAAIGPKIDAYFVNQDSAVVFIENLESLARQASTTFQVSRTELAEENKQPTLKLAVEARGSFKNIFHLLQLLENMPFVTRIDGVELSAGSGQGGRGLTWVADFNLILISFFIKNAN